MSIIKGSVIQFLLSQVRTSTEALIGGKVYFYSPGTTSTAGVEIWLDDEATSAASNPYTLDADGTAQLYASGKYDVLIKDAAGITQFDRKNVTFYNFDNPYEYDALQYTPFTFTQASITAALTAIGVVNKATLLLRPGTWVISSNADWSAYTNVTFKIVPGATISHGAFTLKLPNSEVFPEWFGTTDIAASLNSAIACSVSGGTVNAKAIGDVTFASQVTLNKPIRLLLGAGTITGPGSGWIFEITDNDCEIKGVGNTLKLSTGADGAIKNTQAMRTRLDDIKINMNNVQNAIGVYHLGGWYNSYRNIEIDAATTHSTSTSLKIESVNTGVIGPTGSYGGAYVGTYENFIGESIKIYGDSPTKTTTQTFIRLSAETLLQPILQAQSNNVTLITLDNVSGFTAIGGDYEFSALTSGVVYDCLNTVRGIQSINNQISGSSTPTYINGFPTASGYFMDDFTNTLIGQFHGYYGSTQDLTFGNVGYTNKHHLGTQWNGDEFSITHNLTLISATEGNLDDEAINGFAITMDSSGQCKIRFTALGANPRTLTSMAVHDLSGMIINALPTFADNTAAAALATDRLYKTASGQVMIKY
jgi:hypothetical protein